MLSNTRNKQSNSWLLLLVIKAWCVCCTTFFRFETFLPMKLFFWLSRMTTILHVSLFVTSYSIKYSLIIPHRGRSRRVCSEFFKNYKNNRVLYFILMFSWLIQFCSFHLIVLHLLLKNLTFCISTSYRVFLKVKSLPISSSWISAFNI